MIKVCNTYTLNDLPLGTKGRVIALGLFDGLHMGHMDIIKKAVAIAERDGLTSTVQTFKHLNKYDAKSLYTSEERTKIIEEIGADEILVLDFDELKDTEPDVTMIEEFCDTNEIRLIVVKDRMLEGTDKKISTMWLRKTLADGDVDLARDLCGGRNYVYSGRVVQGKMLGREMGFPTANIVVPEEKYVVRRGVYVSRVHLGPRVLYGVTNIGRRPTVEDAVNDVVETYIFDFDEDIYGAQIYVELMHFLRAETQYPSKEELIGAVNRNKEQALEYIKNLN